MDMKLGSESVKEEGDAEGGSIGASDEKGI